ncbi:hypothetical protein, partial [Nitrosococcus oceani]|uniref:hypothetical protein n=1 Tax=Nitrosococcus oceani TaxID=1229 RepID=UPI001A7E2D4F
FVNRTPLTAKYSCVLGIKRRSSGVMSSVSMNMKLGLATAEMGIARNDAENTRITAKKDLLMVI